jgi:hypothetical protein
MLAEVRGLYDVAGGDGEASGMVTISGESGKQIGVIMTKVTSDLI